MGRGELKNEKVAKKRKMKKLLKDASLASLGLVHEFRKYELLRFSSNLGKICYGVKLGKEQH